MSILTMGMLFNMEQLMFFRSHTNKMVWVNAKPRVTFMVNILTTFYVVTKENP